MPKSKIILALGLFIAVLPELGFPYSWHIFFEVASGLGIALLSVMISIDKRLSLKAKAERRQLRRRSTDVTERRRTVRIGRRASDVIVESIPEATAIDTNEPQQHE